ncbi:MAG TPA: hypothetical protein VH165_35310 [Kofleriaceae bacterium]|jgi:hypothetical protein|nr:hypothetical protein [Kofleriaceae bacterium]
MKRFIELGVVIGSMVTGCATDGDAADLAGSTDPALQDPAASDPTVGTDSGAPVGDPVPAGDPTAAPPAALPPPSIAYAGSSTVSLLPSAGGGVRIHGGSEEGAFALVTYQVAVSGDHATAQFTVAPAAGASFVYALTGSGSGYSTRQLRLQRVPGSNQLLATASTGTVSCGALGNAPTAVALVFDAQAQTFDVQIAGAATACAGLPTTLKGPATGFLTMDASNAGYGGDVTFTGLALF